MTNTQHTPTPWLVVPEKLGSYQIRTVDDDVTIAGTFGYGADDRKDQEAANAAFIVRAVNSHDALIEALSYLEKEMAELAARKNTRYANLHFGLEIARAALRLAKAES